MVWLTNGPPDWGCAARRRHRREFRRRQGWEFRPPYVVWPSVVMWPSKAEPRSRTSPPLGRVLLDSFLKLAHGSDEAVLEHARMWGPLVLGRHRIADELWIRADDDR